MSDHEWCQDVPRDEAVRAAEDAAAVPSIQHRDLPEQVALLWASLGDILGRVVRLEGEMDAGHDEEAAPAVCDPASPVEGFRTERVTLEIVQQKTQGYTPVRSWPWEEILEDWALDRPGESVRVVEQTEAMRVMTKLHRERDAARSECERLRIRVAELEAAKAACEGGEVEQEPVAWRVGSDVYVSEDYAYGVAGERGERVVPLYAAPPEPRGWLTAQERKALEDCKGLGTRSHHSVAVVEALLARESPPRVKVPQRSVDYPHQRDAEWIAAIREAGGEVE